MMEAYASIYEKKGDCVDKKDKGAHNCAKKVCHEQYGEGETIFGQHTVPDDNGFVSHYNVQFEHGIVENVSVEDMEVLTMEGHYKEGHHYEGEQLDEMGRVMKAVGGIARKIIGPADQSPEAEAARMGKRRPQTKQEKGVAAKTDFQMPHSSEGLPPKRVPPGARRPGTVNNEDVDLFDIIKGHLIDEGFADTEEAALAIMTNMSEDWKQSIVEDFPNVKPANRPGDAGTAGLTLIDTGSGTGYINKHSRGRVLPADTVNKIMSGQLMVKGVSPNQDPMVPKSHNERMKDARDKSKKQGVFLPPWIGPEPKRVKAKPTTQTAGYEPEGKLLEGIRDKDPEKGVAAGTVNNEDVDLFDIIKGHLIDEGFADTEESALAIMTNMSEDWKQSIVETIAGGRYTPNPVGNAIRTGAGLLQRAMRNPSVRLQKRVPPGGYSTREGDGKPRETPLWGPGSGDAPKQPQRKPQAPMRDEPLW